MSIPIPPLLALLWWAGALAALEPLPPGAKDALRYEVGWMGNTYPGAKVHVPQDIDALCVAPDGRIFTNVHWEEGGGNCTAIRDGVVLGKAEHTHGWGHEGGWAVAANRQHLFIAGRMGNEGGNLKDTETWPPKGFCWLGVSRRKLEDIRQAAPFPGAKGGMGGTLKQAFAIVDVRPQDGKKQPEDRRHDIAALAASEERLYAACPYDGTIKVLDTRTMERIAAWPVADALGLALDRDGSLWVLARPADGAARFLHLDADGKGLAAAAAPEPGMEAVAICCAPDGGLWVADDGERQQVAVYADPVREARPARWLGLAGGIYAEPAGLVGDGRFNRPGAIAADALGNLIVAHHGSTGGGSTVLECSTGSRCAWRLLGIHFVDMADVDPAADSEVYTKEEHLRLGGAAKPWEYVGYTVDRFRYPQDPRLHLWSAGAWVRRIAAQRILFVLDMNSERLQVYRFAAPPSEIAIPAGLISPMPITPREGWPAEQAGSLGAWPPRQPAGGGWWWCDSDGDGAFSAREYAPFALPPCQGWWVDGAGTIWAATETQGLRAIPCLGLSSQGVPRWDAARAATMPMPEGFTALKRLRYDAQSDTMYLGGTTSEHRNQHWKPMGPVIARYDRWSSPGRTRRWMVCLPYAHGAKGHESCEPMGFDVAGDHLFVPYTGAAKSLQFSTGHIEVLRAADGAPVGSMEPSAEIGEVGLQDVRDCLRAHRRADGTYVVFLEEDYKAKILIYRWKP